MKHVHIPSDATTFDCNQNYSLEKISIDPKNKLAALRCSKCITLNEIPDSFPELITLNCQNCGLKQLPVLPKLTFLKCNCCSLLKRIPTYSMLTELYCVGCDILQEIPHLPNLRTLNCRLCCRLETISALPKVEIIKCGHCYNLSHIPSFPNLKSLDCTSCVQLQTISVMPNLRELYCNACWDLLRLPYLPKLTYASCMYCPKLPYYSIEGYRIFMVFYRSFCTRRVKNFIIRWQLPYITYKRILAWTRVATANSHINPETLALVIFENVRHRDSFLKN